MKKSHTAHRLCTMLLAICMVFTILPAVSSLAEDMPGGGFRKTIMLQQQQ